MHLVDASVEVLGHAQGQEVPTPLKVLSQVLICDTRVNALHECLVLLGLCSCVARWRLLRLLRLLCWSTLPCRLHLQQQELRCSGARR